ncbi:glycosyltransferase family 2 protein [Flavobacterium sp. LHD-80]|uniref:glycosyltransferase family 2 protein n=1 Tax=Flavobacterium sp. LHD-80 TaxID=3071411 RepID=UPI0027DFE9C7|nr:glycosyltransferase family 2 protein [Flavobacterium sp. LHD-80]MDQ6472078.1 glycosyltransferase family 2 protein [Flavobacterium sp. LHD-80]
MSKLSIITINFNNLDGLKRTVESIINQTWQEFEYIIIDGGSTDGSVAYIESKSDKIDYWINEKDTGVYNAMNKGVIKAKGEYLLFLNSGDHFYNNDVLQKCNKFLVEKDLIYFNLNIVDQTASWIRTYTDNLFFSYLAKDTLPHPATFIKKILFHKVGLFDENLKIVSDWKFFIQSICKFNSSYIRIDQTLSTFYLDGLSSDPKNQKIIFDEKQLVLESEFSAFLNDLDESNKQKQLISNLKKSKKIQLLIKLGLLNKF